MKKLNKIKGICTCVLILLSASSCRDYLNEEVFSQYSPEEFYSNATEAEGAMRATSSPTKQTI